MRGIALLLSISIHATVVILATICFRAPPPEQKTVLNAYLVVSQPVPDSVQRVGETRAEHTGYGRAVQKAPKPKTDAPRNGLLRNESANGLLAIPTNEALRLMVNGSRSEPAGKNADSLKHESSGWSAKIEKDGSVELKDAPIYSLKNPFALPGIDEVVMRLRGDTMYDPQKRKFLAETKGLRQEMAKDRKKENGALALQDIQSRLSAIWTDDDLSATEKRRKLFEIWDECAEDGPEEVLNASSMIRVSIISFINRYFPSQSSMAYTGSELSDLNANRKRSKAEFKPYEHLADS